MIGRAKIAFAIVAFASTISIDPRVDRAAKPEEEIEREGGKTGSFLGGEAADVSQAPMRGVVKTTDRVPADVKLAVTKTRHGFRIELGRSGFVVAIHQAGSVAVGLDFVRIELVGDDPRAVPAEMIWESTPKSSTATTRGVISFAHDGDSLAGSLAMAEAPRTGDGIKGARYECASHENGFGGHAVLCLVEDREVAAANVTGARTLQGVFIARSKNEALVRLDLGPARGHDEARLIGFSHGRAGTEIRAEASFSEGDAAAVLVLGAAEKAQPPASF